MTKRPEYMDRCVLCGRHNSGPYMQCEADSNLVVCAECIVKAYEELQDLWSYNERYAKTKHFKKRIKTK
jgi:ribosome-binding protein aMBF1 (putative translation factor)